MNQKVSWYLPLVGILSTLLVGIVTELLTPIIGGTDVYLFYVVVVIVMTWYGGKYAGLLSAIGCMFIAIGYFFVFNKTLSPNVYLTVSEIALFVGISVLLTFFLDTFTNSDVIKEYRRNEQKMLHDLKQSEGVIQKMKYEIQKRDEFLSIASHELNTPLTSMLLKIQIILHNVRNVSLANFSVEKLLKQLVTAEQQTQRLSRMINDLLNVSLITTGKMHLEREEVNLVVLAQNVIDEFSEKLEKAGYTLQFQASATVVCRIDKLRIEQVITNFLSNAIKYGNGKPIEMRVAKHGQNAIVIVKDHGIGIAENQQEKIFALFDRGDINTSYKGLGVGLFIANQIIDSHGGKIQVESETNVGSTFTISFPLFA